VYKSAYGLVLNFGVPLLWLVLTPYPDVSARTGSRLARHVLGLAAVLQSLQAYPWPGSQLRFALFLIIPAAAVCAGDAIAWLTLAVDRYEGRFFTLVRRLEYPVVFGVLALVFLHRLDLVLGPYRAAVPIGMPGARLVRDDERSAATICCLASSLRANADTFICTTGFNSLYFWTGEQPPTSISIGNTIDGPKVYQEAIANALSAVPRVCVVTHANFFGVPSSRSNLLLDYINENFVTSGRVNGFEIKVKKGRPIPSLVDCARWEPARGGGSTIVLNLASIPAGLVNRVSVYDVASQRVIADSRSAAAETALMIFGEDSKPLDTVRDIDLSAPRLLRLQLPPAADIDHHGFLVVRLLDGQGRLLKSVPFLDAPEE
jgi:hypothetical protein